jgi:hypothetical protein
MSNENIYNETVTWADFIGGPYCGDDGDYDDCYGRDALDARRAERDGWGTALYWDGR